MRLNYRQLMPNARSAMLGLERVANAGLANPGLLDLVKIRASQINGCAFCLRLHSNEARERGETDERLDMVAVWREADCFSAAERTALAWSEALTLLPSAGAPDELFEQLGPALHRWADRRTDAGDRRHQRLEQVERCLPHASQRRGHGDSRARPLKLKSHARQAGWALSPTA